ncbi:hypothetical protein LCGC14_1522140 [marine sediment metagenome]|uniref:Uncharacterized protein n=1 Tax=marine sediment metagenome TaxID=412755 RepID=A0A0F9IYK4_9ZZZZ
MTGEPTQKVRLELEVLQDCDTDEIENALLQVPAVVDARILA